MQKIHLVHNGHFRVERCRHLGNVDLDARIERGDHRHRGRHGRLVGHEDDFLQFTSYILHKIFNYTKPQA